MPGPGRPKNRGKNHKQTVVRMPDGRTMIVGRGLPTRIAVDFYSGNVQLRKQSEVIGPDGSPAESVDTTFEERHPFLLQSVVIPLSRKLAEYLLTVHHDLSRITIMLEKPPPLPCEVQDFQDEAIRRVMEKNVAPPAESVPDPPQLPPAATPE